MKVEVGKIVNTHGIKGEVKIKSNSDFTDKRFQPGEIVEIARKDKAPLEFKIASYRMHKGLHMLTFEGINNINDIEYLKGETLLQERDHEEIELGEHEFYYSDIIGCTVFNEDTPIGRVIEIFETGANDVWVVKGDKEYLIPYIADVVKEIDVEGRRIQITPMEGLLD
ncbi:MULTISPECIES: ribosome maturation factor RimM [Staphylococcus]|uniref:Ribosome maturation factor RimM n=1 Tax=Staphylococcus equorum TaxID=246432 RepID=A0A1B1G606_9STAP|nr:MULTISPECIES: ribosome maturation factor RimM [Staphylococcus]ANK37508.1 16S rRNA-processing protein RimM [Staphylococcus sp. AntiMn-1]ANQ64017.1 16S rRNA processing protein RimM [Staphylococcus equorum]ANR67923.1 ribosome maturation factor RimM [Staphylococcus equorum]ERH36008.1 16S rRNA-processing protein RimM [Staphylococcus equorum UMC-CNS-924]KKI54143.1 16S rRNA processing protein RimM [Staphylococcus equorum subsp. equorum]